MSERREPEKWLWTQKDFGIMGWHDCVIHAIAFHPEQSELLLDIDYIFEWVRPSAGETYYKSWISPATLVFWNVNDECIDLEPYGEVQISALGRGEERRPENADYIHCETEWKWIVHTFSGDISLYAAGYSQYIRAASRLCEKQSLTLEERGGFSFARAYN